MSSNSVMSRTVAVTRSRSRDGVSSGTNTASSSCGSCDRSSSVSEVVRDTDGDVSVARVICAERARRGGKCSRTRSPSSSSSSGGGISEASYSSSSSNADGSCKGNSVADNNEHVFAVVTIDSNDIALPPLVASHLCVEASAWCRSDRCRRIGRHRRSKSSSAGGPKTEAKPVKAEDDNVTEIYYDTPLAVYTDRRDVSRLMDGRTYVHFAYLDFAKRNVSLERLLSNLRGRENVILLLNEDPGKEYQRALGSSILPYPPTYMLRTGNVTAALVSEVIASIVNAFLLEERLLHADDIADLVCGKSVQSFRPVTLGMRVDIPRMISCRNALIGRVNDCVECR